MEGIKTDINISFITTTFYRFGCILLLAVAMLLCGVKNVSAQNKKEQIKAERVPVNNQITHPKSLFSKPYAGNPQVNPSGNMMDKEVKDDKDAIAARIKKRAADDKIRE